MRTIEVVVPPETPNANYGWPKADGATYHRLDGKHWISVKAVQCPRCRGKGYRHQRYALLGRAGTIVEIVDCTTCDGEGLVSLTTRDEYRREHHRG